MDYGDYLLKEKIGEGGTAEIFSYGKDKIIKLYFDTKNPNTECEFKNSQFLYHTGFSTPKPYGITKINNRTGLIFERVYGNALIYELLENPIENAKKMAQFICNFHNIDISKKDLSEIQTFKIIL